MLLEGRRLFAGVLLAWGAGLTHAGPPDACHAFADQVKVSGKLMLEAHAGPPNYESIPGGDAREVQPVLHLLKPLCVADTLSRPAGRLHVTRLQLIDEHDKLTASKRRLCRRGCSLTGRLMEAESGHHHTRVLLTLD